MGARRRKPSRRPGSADGEAVAAAVARNLKVHRTRRGWTLDMLASRSGVSKGMLVQIEQARTNPSIATLCRLANALRMALPQLVEMGERPAARLIRADEVIGLWKGKRGSNARLLVGSAGYEQTELWDWRMASLDSYEGDPHRSGTREMLFVLKGTLTLDLDRERYVAQAGDAVIFHADRRHRYRNEAQTSLRFVMVVIEAPLAPEGLARGRHSRPESPP